MAPILASRRVNTWSLDVNYTLSPMAMAISAAATKPAILSALADRFAEAYALDADQVLEALEEREKLGSTGFGRSVAIPHARMTGLNRPVAAFIRLEAPIEFDAADDLPVELVFGLLSPANAGATHLHALAEISRLMRDDALREALLAATSPEALYALLSNQTDRDVA